MARMVSRGSTLRLHARRRGNRTLAVSVGLTALAAWATVGCGEEPEGRSCEVTGDCRSGERCVDGTCQPGFDAGAGADAGGGGEDAGSAPVRDSGPPSGSDGGEQATEDGGPPDATCGGEAVAFDYRPPNVLVVFDRSCSMRRRIDDQSQFGTGPEDDRTRWNTAREAVVTMMGRFSTRVFWGLMAFPDPREGCGDPVDTEVAPAPGTVSAIETALLSDTIQPFGLCGPDNSDTTTQPRHTPTQDAMTSAGVLPELMTTDRARFAILVTDGGVSCGVSDEQIAQLAAELRDAGIPVAVIGFATGADESSLEAIAANGGLPREGAPPSYYVAESREDLDAILDGIAERVVSCELPLSSTPPDSDALFVNVNDLPLDRDDVNGWSYDAGTNSLVFHGDACDQLRSGDVRRIGVAFGCPPTECVPQAETCNGLDDDCDDDVDEDCLM